MGRGRLPSEALPTKSARFRHNKVEGPATLFCLARDASQTRAVLRKADGNVLVRLSDCPGPMGAHLPPIPPPPPPPMEQGEVPVLGGGHGRGCCWREAEAVQGRARGGGGGCMQSLAG